MPILGHDPLEPAYAGRLEEGDPLPFDVLTEPDPRVRQESIRQQSTPFLERLVDQGSAVEVEEIEGLEHEGGLHRGAIGRTAATADPILEQREIGLAVLVERDDLAVDDRLARGDPCRRLEEGAEVAGGILLATGPQPSLTAVNDRLDPKAVPFHLEQPVGVVEGRRDERREHRGHECQPVRLSHGGSCGAGQRRRWSGPS